MTNVPSPHVLVVDDDAEILGLVAKVLEKDGFRVSKAGDGVEMRRILDNSAIDLIVLDLMLPGKDGLTLCRELRGENINTPVVMLTAKGDDIDRILGLEMGADDYLPKPFNSRELIARIKAVLRRNSAGSPEVTPAARFLVFAGWRLDAGNRDLLSPENVIVTLSSGEYELLLALAHRPQRVLSRDQLLDITRGRSAVLFDRSVDIQISRLRRKLGDDTKVPSIIKTVRGGGYLFAVDVIEE